MPTSIPVSLLGKPSDDAEIVALISQGGGKAPKLPRGEVDAYVELKQLGVTLIFADEAYHTENEKMARGEGALLLRSVIFFPEGYRDYTGFDGSLPSGLTFAQNQAVTRSQMGSPEWENANAPAERWLVDGIRIWVRYTKTADSIIQLSMTQPRASELS